MMIAESVHGALRRFFLAPYVGDLRARQIGAVAGSAIILALAYLFIEWIGAKDTGALWAIGLMWLVMTFAFEFTLDRFAFGYPWQRILEDYDLSKGGLHGIFPDGGVRLAMPARRSHERRGGVRYSGR